MTEIIERLKSRVTIDPTFNYDGICVLINKLIGGNIDGLMHWAKEQCGGESQKPHPVSGSSESWLDIVKESAGRLGHREISAERRELSSCADGPCHAQKRGSVSRTHQVYAPISHQLRQLDMMRRYTRWRHDAGGLLRGVLRPLQN